MTPALRTDVVERALADRTRANRDFFDAEADRLARSATGWPSGSLAAAG